MRVVPLCTLSPPTWPKAGKGSKGAVKETENIPTWNRWVMRQARVAPLSRETNSRF